MSVRVSREALSVLVNLSSHPKTNKLGVMLDATREQMARDSRLSLENFNFLFEQLLGAKMLQYDDKAKLLWIPSYSNRFSPEGDKAKVRALLEKLPGCELSKKIRSEFAKL